MLDGCSLLFLLFVEPRLTATDNYCVMEMTPHLSDFLFFIKYQEMVILLHNIQPVEWLS
uniref:Uncharacterized protein n=1 Tax=Rhizophora mucronata TaxID=61149 RepID=A0A2P2Q4H6_RHIMU